MKIQIPVPCHENWDTMVPQEKGRYCSSCCKTVVDFTHMTTDDIAAYLIRHQSQKICGRLTEAQLAKEYDTDIYRAATHIAHSEWSLMKKIAAVFVLFFALSYTGNAQIGEKDSSQVAVITGTKLEGKITLKKDSIVLSEPIPPQNQEQCLEGFVGGLVITEQKKTTKRKLKQIQKQQRKQQRAAGRLAGEVVILGGAFQTE
ncbi:hypothetical protein [Niabella beijingensis]|uniref:hypothetical protein n=1 Tax=Niabella beijingensis TaxID=2872700 RepID=UPI001CBE62C6|nr:hypothetical protein [Niabella beijingensis]MBZ4191111.1 hypothetical protein [Niabella beijingensis]